LGFATYDSKETDLSNNAQKKWRTQNILLLTILYRKSVISQTTYCNIQYMLFIFM